jgi:hypothetical protein
MPSDDAHSERRLAVLLLLAAAVLQVVIVYVRTGHTYYFADDFLNFEIFRQERFSRSYFLRDVFGQLVPGYRAVQGVMFKAFGLNYFPALAVICALTVGSLLVTIAIGRRLRASLPLVIAISLPLIFQLQTTNAQLWWSTSLHSLPGLFAVLLGLWFLVGRDGRPEDHGAYAGAVCFGAGLMFFSKVMFSGAIYFGILLFLRQQGQPASALVRNALATLRQLRFVILVAIGWSVVLSQLTDSLSVPKPPFDVVVATIWKSISDGTLAALLGLGSHGALLFGSYELTIAVSSIVFAAVVIATFRVAGRYAAILWSCYAVYVVAAMGAIAITRAQHFGSDVGRSLRYNIENATFLLLILLVAFAARPSADRPQSYPSRRAATVGVVLAVLVSINLQVQSRKLPDHWNVAAVRSYVDALSHSLAEMRGKENVTISDEPVPDYILLPWMAPYNQYRFFMTLFPGSPPVVASERATHRIAQDGKIVPR